MTTLSFEALWKDRGATAGLKGLAAGTKAARISYDDLRTATVRAAGAMKNAQLNIADATRAVAVQEARLKEARASGTAKASQILAIEDRLASARRREADATEAAKRAAVDLTQATEREAKALSLSSRASAAAGRGLHGLGTGATAAAKGGMRALSDGASVASRSVGKVASSLGGLTAAAAKWGAVALAAGAAGAAGFGVKIASGNEQARISFTTMLGSAQKADKFLRQLQKFAAATPFEFPELQTAASSLISVGIRADKVIPIMKSLGNATSGMGTGSEGIKRATVALQQMNASGKISAEDLNQLRDAGIPVYELLAKATGKSSAKIADMAANGKLGRKELEQLMKALESGKGLERFAGLMDKQSHSLAGLWSTFKDTAGQALAGVATSAFPLMKSGLAAISTGLGHLSAWVKDNRGALGSVFKVIGSTLSTLGGTIKTVFGSFADSAGLGKKSFKDFADFLATHQEDITKGIIGGAKAFISFGKILATVASGGLRAFGSLADGIGHVETFILDQYAEMAHGAALAFGWIPGLGPKLIGADVKFAIFAAHVHGNIHKTGDAARSLADGIDSKVVPALDKAGHGLDAYGKKAIASAHAKDVLAKAELRHRDALAVATAAAKANGKTLDSNTISGRDNRAALNNLVTSSQNYIAKLVATHASSKRVTAATADARAEFVRVATKMSVSRDRAQEMANKLFKVRTEARGVAGDIKGIKSRNVGVDIHFTANSKSVASAMAANVKSYAVMIRKNAGGYTGGVVGFGGGLHIRRVTGGVLPGYTPGRDVHRFYSPTAGELDLSGGEAIMVPEWTKAVGGPAEVARKNADARAGRLGGFAAGGILDLKASYNRAPSFGDINAATASSTALANAWGSAMAHIVASAMTKMTAAARAAIAGAGGGPVAGGGYAKALGYARNHAGHPYWYGTIWDCSGLISSLQSIIYGQAPHRRWSTPAFAGNPSHAQGFTRGKRSAFMIGVNPSPGKFGHTAGTLNGVNVEEAGGVGLRVGRSARGWNNSMFSWRGGLAKGGVIGDLPFDLLDPQGERYSPWLADLVHKAGYNRGGRIGGDGPERILSAPQNRAFEHLVRVMDRRGGGAGVTVNQYVTIPHYVGSVSDLKRALVDLSRRGELAVIQR
jgi:tape measure domain-containing protein